jgi:hypothetical protein
MTTCPRESDALPVRYDDRVLLQATLGPGPWRLLCRLRSWVRARACLPGSFGSKLHFVGPPDPTVGDRQTGRLVHPSPIVR